MMPDLTIADATHNLVCRHCIGRSCKTYYMKSVLLSKTRAGKAKILVFGERYWKGNEHIKQIRYVNIGRLREIIK